VDQEIIVNSTSVWKTLAKIRIGNLRGEYLDLFKLNNLYVHNQSNLFKELRVKLNLSQRKCAKLIGKSNVTNYENLNQAIPFYILLKLSELANFDLYDYLNTNVCRYSLGNGSEIPVILPITKDDAIEFSKIIRPSKLKVGHILYPLKDNDLFNNFNFCYNKHGTKLIHSNLLWNYFNTYFEYHQKSILNFPLNDQYHNLKLNKVSDDVIIATLLITEGSKQRHGFDFSNKSKVLHDLFVEAIYANYSIFPTTYFNFVGDVYRTYYLSGNINEIRNYIEEQCGNIQTIPVNNLLSFLNQKQPTLKFASLKQDIISLIRLFSVTEGGVYFKLARKNKNESIAVPEVYISCSHPKLLLELYNFMVELGFHPSLKKDKTWSGWAGVSLPSFSDAITFLNIGGFIPYVPVARKDSCFCGIDKQILFLSILELRREMLFSYKLRKMTKPQLINELFRIINNKEYNLEEMWLYNGLLNLRHNKKKIRSKRHYELKKDVYLMLNHPEKFINSRIKV